MTLAEYSIRMEAYQLKQVKRHEEIALQAFMNQAVKATKGKSHPKPVYRKFEQFFNTQEQIDKVRSSFEPNYARKVDNKKNTAAIFAKRVEEFKKLKKSGKIIPLNQRERR